MKIKQLIFPIIILLSLAFTFGYFKGKTKRLERVLSDHELKILSHDKQIPYIAKYIRLVKGLQAVSKNKLTAFEIVEISRIILIQCQLNQNIGLTPGIVMAVMERESAFDPKAISKARAYGLMQLLQPTIEDHLDKLGYGKFAVDLALNPIVNVECGIKELVRLRKYWLAEDVDSWMIVINSYYWGIRNTWDLLLAKKRAKLPSLEYGKGVLDLAKKWKERGL